MQMWWVYLLVSILNVVQMALYANDGKTTFAAFWLLLAVDYALVAWFMWATRDKE